MEVQDLEKAEVVFKVYDTTGEGTIKAVDIGNVLRALDRIPLESEVQKEIKKLGENSKITFPQFVSCLNTLSNVSGTAEAFKNTLKTLESTGTGFIPRHELRQLLTTLGEKITAAEVDSIIIGLPQDTNGNVSCDAFVDKIMTHYH